MKTDIKAQSTREQEWKKKKSDQMPVRGEDISKRCALVLEDEKQDCRVLQVCSYS